MGNLKNDDIVQQGLPPCKAVINLAGENLLNPAKRWNADYVKSLYDSRIETTRTLATAINQAEEKPSVFVCGSAVGYYPPSVTTRYTEASPGGEGDFMAELCKNWEAAGKLQDESGVRHVIIRTGVVLGRNGGMIQSAFLPFFLGLGGRVASGEQFLPWIHIDDIVGIFVHAVENDHANGVFNGVAPECCTNAEFTRAFASAMRRPAFFPVPEFLLNFVFGEERAKVMTRGQCVVPQRVLETGYVYKFADIRSACDQCAHLA
ncbi:PREDICTED: epimerase family protein SDR39U1-like [Priapulus caudatus]|uniref:Epimerase family protein SDR39U1-like n=1 Tax=Priapulus caudatus TaxID=37621 RepID=A0ABM1EJ37_PRICU|nr:PREDICTED: epimerase family protein SDR39U1-like [Priapulus caudatus]